MTHGRYEAGERPARYHHYCTKVSDSQEFGAVPGEGLGRCPTRIRVMAITPPDSSGVDPDHPEAFRHSKQDHENVRTL